MKNYISYTPAVNLLTPEELSQLAAEFQPLSPCRKCNGWTVNVSPGKGPHWARLNCSNCGKWRRWLTKPKYWQPLR